MFTAEFVVNLQKKVKNLGNSQEGERQKGVEAYLAAPATTKATESGDGSRKKQKTSDGGLQYGNEERKKKDKATISTSEGGMGDNIEKRKKKEKVAATTSEGRMGDRTENKRNKDKVGTIASDVGVEDRGEKRKKKKLLNHDVRS